ncbi:hypothetical protein M1K46_19565 [Fictibacillus sp. WQ 8-8]|uniref:hypothetical protein n=1 Tax=Fictibacillus sp. WQ 8-8 TaxID=2938788 RepID=UPI00210E7EB3|nr:hypothetical protein [Fictibacillus sp. WQ 8-8]MCQ6267829.1 hypothetical protein [Fictibacillus sp. WQ 8-8]
MKNVQIILSFIIVMMLAACNGGASGEKFDPKVEKKNATESVNSVLNSFKDQEKLAEAKTSDEANTLAWKKFSSKNKEFISKDLAENEQKKLLYLVTLNKAQDTPNGGTKANLLFSQDTKVNEVKLNKEDETFTFDIKRSGFDHKAITTEKQEDTWKIVQVKDSE